MSKPPHKPSMTRSRNKKQSSTMPWHHEVPLDLLTDILVRVESKSLLRFRCVSKTWREIIDDSKFSVMQLYYLNHHRGLNKNDITIITLEHHHNMTYTGTKFMLRHSGTLRKKAKAEEFAPSSVSQGIYYKVLGYVYGVFLLTKIGLWNPLTRKTFQLPRHPLFFPCGVHDFDTKYALGFDHSMGDYKVLAMRHPFMFKPPGIGIYTHSSGCWRSCSADVVNDWISTNLAIGYYERGVFALGAINWLGYDMGRKITRIVSFDLSSEAFKFSTLPDDDDGVVEKVRMLFLLGESLAVFYVSKIQSCIWVMEQDGGGEGTSWTKWYSNHSNVENFMFFETVLYAHCTYSLLFLEKTRKFLVGVHGKVTSYDIENHERRALAKTNRWSINYIDFYSESLAL